MYVNTQHTNVCVLLVDVHVNQMCMCAGACVCVCIRTCMCVCVYVVSKCYASWCNLYKVF